ncbi:MAG TPA: DUF2723 domain-containing protein [bacterium]|nr:DUF2723 domain-containing protein [bacterium]
MVDTPPSEKISLYSHRIVFFIVFITAFAGFLPGLCPSVYWLDSGELQAAVPILGIPHSPSFPLFVLSTRPFGYLPFGDNAFRTNLATACAGAVMAVIVGWLCFNLFGGQATYRRWIAVMTGWLAVMNPLVWFQNLKAEIYSLNMVLLLGITLTAFKILDQWGNRRTAARYAAVMIVLIGFGICNHSLLTAHVLPSTGILILCLLPRLKRQEILLIVLLGILSVSMYLYLPIRSSVNPLLDTGNPEQSMNFINAVTRRGTFNRFFGNTSTDFFKNGQIYWNLLQDRVSLPFLILAALGLLGLLLKRTRHALLLISMMGVNIAVTLMNRNFNANPDTGPAYLMLSTTIWVIGAGFCLFTACQWLGKDSLRKYLIPVILLIPPVFLSIWILSNFSESTLASDESAGVVGRSILDTCDTDAAVFYGMYHNLPFVVNYLQYVERYRVDVMPVNRGEIVYWPGGLENLAARYPELVGPVYDGIYGETLRYLAPRSCRHSGIIPYERARDLLFNASAWMAQWHASDGATFWFPSEDDHLLRTKFVPWGPMFRLGFSGYDATGGDPAAMDRLILRRTRLAENCGFQQTYGAMVLGTYYDLQCITLRNRSEKMQAANAFELSGIFDPDLGRNCEIGME